MDNLSAASVFKKARFHCIHMIITELRFDKFTRFSVFEENNLEIFTSSAVKMKVEVKVLARLHYTKEISMKTVF